MHSMLEIQPGEGVLFDGRVCLVYLDMQWPDSRLRVTDRRLLWEPVEDCPFELRRAQIVAVASSRFLFLARTVITGTQGHCISILTVRSRALQDALAYLMATPVP